VLQATEGGEVVHALGGGPVGGQAGQPVLVAVEGLVAAAQRLVLEPVARLAVDARVSTETPAGRAQLGHPPATLLVQPSQLGDGLDSQVERVAEEAAGREIGARLARRRRVQRVEQDERRAKLARHLRPGEHRQVAEVAEAPTLAGACRVELGREAPGTAATVQPRRQMAAGRRHHQEGRAAVAIDAVVAERQVAWQLRRHRPLLPGFQHQPRQPVGPEGAGRPPAQHHDRWPWARWRGLVGAHGGKHRLQGARGDLVMLAGGIIEAGRDAGRQGTPTQLVQGHARHLTRARPTGRTEPERRSISPRPPATADCPVWRPSVADDGCS
jgi:hypothetical protein